MSADVVFLLPGLLGFERAGNFSNFADRVVSALRTHLEGRTQRSIPVIPLPSFSTTTFAERQRELLAAMAQKLGGHTDLARIHLLGHSVGGVDAYLLACERPLSGVPWSVIDPHGLAAKVRSVISLAAPHAGTAIANAPGAEPWSVRAVVQNPQGAAAKLDLMRRLFASAARDLRKAEGAQAALREYRKVSHFMAESLRWDGFLHALTPEAMHSLYAGVEPRRDVVRRSFVTMAGRPRPDATNASGPDALFELLSRRAAGEGNGFTRHPQPVRDAISALRSALDNPSSVIVSSQAAPPDHVDAHTNDGIVNSVRQLASPTDPEELAAVVIADHFDVLGYYDRGLGLAGSDAVSGLLHSGSCFRDAEFFALYRRVGDEIAAQCAQSTHVERTPAQEEPVAPPAKRKKSRTPSRRPTA